MRAAGNIDIPGVQVVAIDPSTWLGPPLAVQCLCDLWNESEVLIIAESATGPVEAINTAIKHNQCRPAATATQQTEIHYSLEKRRHDTHSGI